MCAVLAWDRMAENARKSPPPSPLLLKLLHLSQAGYLLAPNEYFIKMVQVILLAVFILLTEWLTGMLFIIHCGVCSVDVCVIETGLGPLPAHYSLAVLRVYARVGCVFRPYWLFLRCMDPHYCPHTVTSICSRPSLFFSSRHALQPALSVPRTHLTPREKNMGIT